MWITYYRIQWFLSFVPRPSNCPVLITCSMQKWRGKAWSIIGASLSEPHTSVTALQDPCADLPTHPLFLSDTRILQGSPAHQRRIASHPHLARYTSAALSVDLFCWSSQPLDHEDEAMPYSGNFDGENLRELMKKKKDFCEENSRGLLAFAAPRMPRPQILRGKPSRIATKPKILRKLVAFPGWSSAYTCYARAFRSGKPWEWGYTFMAIHVYTYQHTLDFVSLVPRP